MGVYLGEESSLIPALEENPKGFWERQDVLDLDKKIMNEMGANWYRVHDFDVNHLDNEKRESFKVEIRKIISKLNSKQPWAIKEPRLSLLFPLWKSELENVLCLHMARHPLEVAKSLKTRNNFPLAAGIALWEFYVTEEIKHIWNLPKLTVLHNNLMKDPVAVVKKLHNDLARIGVTNIQLPSDEEITDFIDSKLYKEKANSDLENSFLPRSIINLWNDIESGKIWESETPPLCSQASLDVLEIFSKGRLANDYNQIYKDEIESLRKTTANSLLKERIKELSDKQSKLRVNLDSMRKLSFWYETISGALHHTLGSRHWQIGTKLIPIAEDLKKEITETAKTVLHYQTWEGRNWANYISKIDREKLNLNNYKTDSQETIKSSTVIVEGHISEIQNCISNSDFYIDSLRVWLHQIIDCYNKITSSKSWSLGNKIIEKPKKIFNKRALPWQHEVAFYSRTFKDWEIDRFNEPAIIEENIESKRLEQKIFYDLSPDLRPRVSLIVLNKDGEEHLRNLFDSFLAHNSFPDIEFIIVDHGSSDASISIIESYSKRVPLKLLAYKENYSYSHSNNKAAELAQSPYLFFVNNDIIFTDDILQELVFTYEEQENVSLLGTRLFFPDPGDKFKKGLIQHAGVTFSEDHDYDFYRPKNIDGQHIGELPSADTKKLPAVTAATLFCKKDVFLEAGGFSEDYFYGYEDVDLSLRFLKNNKFSAVANHISLIHDESATRNKSESAEKTERSLKNISALKKSFAYELRRAFETDKFKGSNFWNLNTPVIGFAVTESKVEATAGDYFTAYELADHCRREFGWQSKFLAKRDKNNNWYDLEGIDVLITLIDQYDLRQIVNAKSNLIKVAWLRNWFDRWAEQPWFKDYDLCLCSSKKSANFIKSNYDKDARVFRIATNSRRFQESKSKRELDCVFTGSYWKAKREIEDAFNPGVDGPSFEIYGHGWGDHPKLSKYHKGFLAYEKLPEIYQKSKIVLDDANHVTKDWASINSRVFDAIASGCLVITNGKEGVNEIFSDLLPTYSSPLELEKTVQHYLKSDNEREKVVKKLKEIVLENHTYSNRAHELQDLLVNFSSSKYRIAIKVPVPRIEEAESWGDYHFATALKQEFDKLGHSVRIDVLADWDHPKSMSDQIVIVLRGLSKYTPKPEHINLMWNISHPDKVSLKEYDEYDHVFIASKPWAENLKNKITTPLSTLIQCTNEKYFFPDQDAEIPSHDVLFVGNSRKEFRQIVKDSISSKLPISVYGTRWEGIIDESYVCAQNIPNRKLRKYYSNAKIVLNDHWASMSANGFISNRIFDVAATGSCLISDRIDAAKEVFGDALCTYDGAKDLKEKVEFFLANEKARLAQGERLQNIVNENHTFRARVSEMLEVIDKLDAKRRFPEIKVDSKQISPTIDNLTKVVNL